RAERLFTIPAGAFQPRPQVDSAVLRLTPLETPLLSDPERQGFRRLVVGLFGFRRKQVIRGLRELTGWGVEAVEEVLRRTGIEGRARPETLPPAEFVALLRSLVDCGWPTR
ncbi:MAG: rRNA adenine N-6-methyltransferase family protein, partial [Gemmatimonadales bacterium]